VQAAHRQEFPGKTVETDLVTPEDMRRDVFAQPRGQSSPARWTSRHANALLAGSAARSPAISPGAISGCRFRCPTRPT
jgi:hypothetical protein